MWYIKNTKNSWFILALIFLSSIGCSEQESDIHLFYGEWNVRDSNTTLVNGKQGSVFIQNYFIELNSENCGIKYNLDKEKTNRIKWLFNEGDVIYDNYFLLSIQSNSTENKFNLGKDNLYLVSQLSEEDILLTRSKIRISNDTTFKTIWNLRFTK